jgi:hypothetical protein
MNRMRILGLALVSVFAIVAISAASASAAPAWYECAKASKNAEKKYTGSYTDKVCSVKASPGEIAEGKHNKYELQPGVGKGKAFKTSGTLAKLHTVIPGQGDVPVECAKYKGTGKATLPNKVEKVVTTFEKCKAAGAPCASGTKKETIVTTSTEGELGYISDKEPSKPVVGVDLKPEGGGYFATFTCTGVAEIRTTGSVIAEVTGDVNTINKEAHNVFAIGPYLGEVEYAPGKKYTPLTNIPEFEGGSPDILLTELNTGKGFEPAGGLPSGQEANALIKGEALEVKA